VDISSLSENVVLYQVVMEIVRWTLNIHELSKATRDFVPSFLGSLLGRVCQCIPVRKWFVLAAIRTTQFFINGSHPAMGGLALCYESDLTRLVHVYRTTHDKVHYIYIYMHTYINIYIYVYTVYIYISKNIVHIRNWAIDPLCN
jgi:hypothetical protein